MDRKWKTRLWHVLKIECVTYNFGDPAKRKQYIRKKIVIKVEKLVCTLMGISSGLTRDASKCNAFLCGQNEQASRLSCGH